MASKNDNCDDSIRIDQNALLGEMDRFTGATRHIKAAGYGLAAPLSTLRLNQMRAETARAKARYGEKSDIATGRSAQLQAATVRADALTTEFNRTLVDPPKPDARRNQAGIYGRVVDAGEPKADLVVGALDDKEQWQGHTCTGERGDFAFSTTADTSLRLVVTDKAGAPLYRDQTERTYAPGQVVFREIDLAITDRPCDGQEGGSDEEPEPTLVTVPELVGLREADAVDTLRKAGLARGDRSTRPDDDNVGRVVEQDPESGAEVERGTAVAIIVGISTEILMPEVVGAPVDIARQKLAEIPHESIDIEEEPDPDRIGIVLAQIPDKGTVMTPNTGIVLTVGVADRLVMPGLIGEKLEAARETLASLGLADIEISQQPDRQRVGLVVDQKPAGGSEINEDTAVTLVVGVARELPNDDTPQRFRAVIDTVVADQRFGQLDMSRGDLERTLEDHEVTATSDLRRLSDAQPQAIRAELDLRTLKAAKALRILLRAALKALDRG